LRQDGRQGRGPEGEGRPWAEAGEGVCPFPLMELELEGKGVATIFLLKIHQLNYGLIREGFL
jgi:hypothetical protein